MNNSEIALLIIAVILCVCFGITGKILNDCGVNPFTQKIRPRYKNIVDYNNFEALKTKLTNLLNTFNKTKETNLLLHYEQIYTRKQRSEIAHKYDSVYSNFKDYIDKKTYSNRLKEIKCMLIRLKYYFKQKRPRTDSIFLISGQSPRYPSGHGAQYYYMYLILKDKFPNDSDKLKNIAKKGMESRLIAGVHFPIDIKAGIKVAEYVYNILH